MRHPARTRSFDDLKDGLDAAQARRAVYRRFHPATGLSLWIYSDNCVYDDLWDDYALMARGLILHEDSRSVVATPFPKFFNAGEKRGAIPDGPFEAFEKLDGSLIVLFWWDAEWRTATKGAFDSVQALWAKARISEADLSPLVKGTTYLLEATYPENRIVVFYEEPALVFLAAFYSDGEELSAAALRDLAATLGWPVARRHAFASVTEMIEHAAVLPACEEGFVVRWADGTRLKIKGAEYRRIHALISRITPLAVWEMIVAGDDIDAVRRQIPEEFWADFDAINAILGGQIAGLRTRLEVLAREIAALSDKDVGLALQSYPADIRGYLFLFRKKGWAGAREKVEKSVRPTGNVLAGYVPSYAMSRVMEEMA